MIVYACYNNKGGVGKTTTAVNLAYLAARDGFRTLVWDLDPQGASSYYFRVKPKIKGNSKTLAQGDIDLEDIIKGTDYYNLDLIPSDISYRKFDIVLDLLKRPKQGIEKLISTLTKQYDVLFLDCAPTISLISENVFRAADYLLIPTIPTPLSIRTYEQLIEFRSKHKFSKTKLVPFFSMVDIRKSLHRSIVESPPSLFTNLLESHIPYASDVEKMSLKREPLHCFAGSSNAAKAYEGLWAEIINKSISNK